MSTELADAAEELGSWLAVAETLIAVHDIQPHARRSSARLSAAASRPPWNPQVADAILDAHTGVRRLEEDFRIEVTGRHRTRGGSDGNTARALVQLSHLEPSVSRETAKRARHALGQWLTALMRLPSVDLAPTWEKIRAGPDGTPPVCPHCKTYSLRVDLSRGLIACWFPGCEDSKGKRPTAHLTMNKVDGTPVVIWRDGAVM